jgi:hypothetical protein
MNPFRAANTCAVCKGNASYRLHRVGVVCSGMSEPHMHRKCEDCGFSWGETPAAIAPSP